MNKFEFSHVVTFVVAMALLSASNIASATVGKVIYGYGDNYALDRDGNRRDMRKGSKINEGDTLITGRGRMHVRLRDGGYVSVYPNSEYKIETFVYEEKSKVAAEPSANDKPAKKEQGIFSLLKGAARQVTGLLGKYNREDFKFKTPVATIGIRGTGFFAKLCQSDCFDADGNLIPDGLYVKNNTGVITMTTDAGDIALAQGQSAFAASKSDSPQQILQPPVVYNVVNPDIEQYDFDEKIVDTQLTNGSGPVVDPGSNPSSVPGLTHLEYISSSDSSHSFNQLGGLDISEVGSSVQQNGDAVEHFDDATGIVESMPLFFDKGTATLAESGSDVTLGVLWNRWSGGYELNETGSLPSLDDEIHLIGTNNLTPSLPGAGRDVVQYESTGGTSPTITGFAGNQVGTQMIAAEIDYRSGVVNNFQVDATFSNATFSANLLTLTNLNGTSNIVSLIGSCSGSGCSAATPAGVSGSASLNLVGPNAEGIYGIYNLTNFENSVSGSYVAPEKVTGPAL